MSVFSQKFAPKWRELPETATLGTFRARKSEGALSGHWIVFECLRLNWPICYPFNQVSASFFAADIP